MLFENKLTARYTSTYCRHTFQSIGVWDVGSKAMSKCKRVVGTWHQCLLQVPHSTPISILHPTSCRNPGADVNELYVRVRRVFCKPVPPPPPARPVFSLSSPELICLFSFLFGDHPLNFSRFSFPFSFLISSSTSA